MQTAQARQQYTKNGEPVSLATCIETLYFEQQYNGQVYRTSLNNRLLEDDDKNIKSIVLTVNRYLTGVSMPLIDSMIYLKNA